MEKSGRLESLYGNVVQPLPIPPLSAKLGTSLPQARHAETEALEFLLHPSREDLQTKIVLSPPREKEYTRHRITPTNASTSQGHPRVQDAPISLYSLDLTSG